MSECKRETETETERERASPEKDRQPYQCNIDRPITHSTNFFRQQLARLRLLLGIYPGPGARRLSGNKLTSVLGKGSKRERFGFVFRLRCYRTRLVVGRLARSDCERLFVMI